MKAKTKRRLIHLVTKKKLVKKHISRHFIRSFFTFVAIVSLGSLAYGITLNKPTLTIPIHGTAAGGVQIQAPVLAATTPVPVSGTTPTQTGRGSWYALGLPQPDALTCASRTYPRGTYLHVTNLRNHRTVVCRVNDYGPAAWTNRIIDLSRGSFTQIDSLGAGTAPVELRVASGPSGFNLNIKTDVFTAMIGYNLCLGAHSPEFCETHRQD